MARRRLIWHIGLAQASQDVVGASLEAHRAPLEEAGARVAATQYEARLATHELLRTHRRAGLKRSVVEGQWARISDRVWDHKGVSLLSTPDLCAADKDQLRLALDPLIGVEVHLDLTVEPWEQQLYGAWLAELRSGGTTSWETYAARVEAAAHGQTAHQQGEDFCHGHDVDAILARWGWTFHAERLHVVQADPAGQWSQFLDLAGVTTRLPARPRPAEVVTPSGEEALDPGAAQSMLAATLHENDELRLQVGALERENARLDRKRRKHKRKLKQLQAVGEN